MTDHQADTPVFHTPLKYMLTPYTSDLRSKISAEQWEGLEGGWSRLILVMMYETEQGEKSPWAKYLRMSSQSPPASGLKTRAGCI
jgi:hypothetical protein